MELDLKYPKKSLVSFIYVERDNAMEGSNNIDQQEEAIICDQEDSSSPSMPSSPHTTMPLPPPSPESPWTLSPLQTPSPSLLYHCIASLHRREGTIYSIAISRQQGLVFTGSKSTRIRVWRQPDYIEYGCIKATSGEVRSTLAYGDMLFTTHKDHKIRIWNFKVPDNFRSKKVSSIPKKSSFSLFSKTNTQKHKECVSCLAYYHAEGLLYTGSYDKTVKAWRVLTKNCVASFVAHEHNVNAILVKQDDGCVFTCSADGSVKIWRRVFSENSHTLIMTLNFQNYPIYALALSTSSFNSNCFLYSGSSDGTINFWEKEKITYRFNHGGFLQGHNFAVLCLVAVERLIFSGSEDTTIRVWRREEGSCFHECLAVLNGHRGPVRCLAACLEMDKVVKGFLVYSASLDQSFKVWRVKVSPEEKMGFSYMKRSFSRTKVRDYETSPVLSPSWVERKLLQR
ncbi:hypothetical protein Pyn_30276 [Prunus yedoensis var. nudiflora]|uniref:Uncharacterized protein n=1 Tax=Prunus yedoensis var. nudiflora TaxID=2094558 RepID=A0A314YI82_PRUYE|nr:hypothetical protein Pyn_30276 [Prunus yedoensis var. nudiflora]